MSSDTNTGAAGWLSRASEGASAGDVIGVMIAWSLAEPSRVGEIALVHGGQPWVLGRGAGTGEEPRLDFRRHRPGMGLEPGAGRPLGGDAISRRQLVLRAQDGRLEIENIGKQRLVVDGRAVARAVVRPGEVIMIEDHLVLLCVARPSGVMGGRAPEFPFGDKDRFGIIGESPAAWALRDAIAFYAGREGHVLIHGPSGAGKELAARALHALSDRARGPFVARSAATIPESIVDAELFGNAKNYPNAGMRERPGLVGEAEGGTLFLDEIGELSEAAQGHLLRLLDGGEYHRLGEETARRADVRMVCATNRDAAALKHDLLARLTLRLEVPALAERVDDVPLIVRALLRDLARRDPIVRERFFEGDEARIHPELVAALLQHDLGTNVRELSSLLMLAMSGSRGDYVALTRDVSARLRPAVSSTSVGPSREEVLAALAREGGNVSRAWRLLGLSSRDALNRLIKKYGIEHRAKS